MSLLSRSQLAWASSAVIHSVLLAGLGTVVTLVVSAPPQVAKLSLEPTSAARYVSSVDEPTLPAPERLAELVPLPDFEPSEAVAEPLLPEPELVQSEPAPPPQPQPVQPEPEPELVQPEPTPPPQPQPVRPEPEPEAARPVPPPAPSAVANSPKPSEPAPHTGSPPLARPAPAGPSRPQPSKAQRARAVFAPPPRRPARCARRGHRGTCTLEVEIGASGVIRSAAVVRSAGCTRLDQAAREAVAGYRFEPARDAAGSPCASRERVEVTFR